MNDPSDGPPSQWYKADSYFLAKPFAQQLAERFGPAGIVTWQAFLAACKRNHIQGRFSYTSDAEAVQILLLEIILPLRDNDGEPWTLEEFWEFTGRHKQTRRTTRGRISNVISTHWERWNNSQKRADVAERQRRWRAQNRRDTSVTENEREIERENTPPTPPQSDPLVAALTKDERIKNPQKAKATVDQLRRDGHADIDIAQCIAIIANKPEIGNVLAYLTQMVPSHTTRPEPPKYPEWAGDEASAEYRRLIYTKIVDG